MIKEADSMGQKDHSWGSFTAMLNDATLFACVLLMKGK